MSLATRCPHCNTIFKVVQDQLKVSEGWVRCGRCQEVFNALEGLFDMEREPPPQRLAGAPGWQDTQADIQPQEELVPPPSPPQTAQDAPAGPLTEEPIAVMDAPRGAVTHFDLELPPSPESLAAAISGLMQPPYEPPAEALPVTDEADALDSRYLLQGDERRPPSGRRRAGGRRAPEFADARFPTDAMADAMEWDGYLPESGNENENETPLAGDVDVAPESPPASAHPAEAALFETPPAGARLLARVGPDTPDALQDGQAEAGPTTLPSRFHEAYQPEQSLPPPSKRKGRPGTRGRSPQPSDEPEFIRQAERQAIWRHPVVRGLLSMLALALLLLLAGQAAHHERDLLASRFPATAPWLQRWCELAACRLEAPMLLDQLQVDNIELVRTSSQGEDTYRLTAIVRNQAEIPLAWPQLDLSLTDANGQVVVRRIFAVDTALSENRTPLADRIPASSTVTLQWQLRAPDLQLAGYTAELFYP